MPILMATAWSEKFVNSTLDNEKIHYIIAAYTIQKSGTNITAAT